MRLTPLLFASALTLGCALTDVRDASACGGWFYRAPTTVQPETERSSAVTDHRMVLKIGRNETVLWDQVRYTGDPDEFAWVLPVREGARVELSRDQFIHAANASTRTTVRAPIRECRGSTAAPSSSGGGCGSESEPASINETPRSGSSTGFGVDAGAAEETESVSVVAQSVIGPYLAVTLRAKNNEGVSAWLTENGFAIPSAVVPAIEAYTREGYDFIAMRLRPGQGVRAMRPVRIVTPGSDATLPLRMATAGARTKLDLTLWVIAEGRYEAQSFPNAVIDETALKWDLAGKRSNLKDLQSAALASNGGRTWLTEASSPQTLSESFFGAAGSSSLGALYMQQCTNQPSRLVPCDEDALPSTDGGAPAAGDAGTEDAGASTPPPSACMKRVSGCDDFDDLEVARRGLNEPAIWVTRLRAALPVSALDTDLRLRPAAQTQVTAQHVTDVFTDPNANPCANEGGAAPPSDIPPEDDSACTCRTTRPLPTQAGTYVLIAVTALAAARVSRRRR